MSFESGPRQRDTNEKSGDSAQQELAALKKEFEPAMEAFMSETASPMKQLLVSEITGVCKRPRIEKFLTDNYDLLAKEERDFLLLSLRIKQLEEDSARPETK
jgi:hypothetical protein